VFVDERKGDLNFFIKRHVIEESNILDNFINKKLKTMKTLGILGGVGPETTSKVYHSD